MIEAQGARVVLSRDDLLAAAEHIEARANDAEDELARLIVVRRLVAASFELNRALRMQTQCALVNHCGTPGSRSLREATEYLWDALAAYVQKCGEVAGQAQLFATYSEEDHRRNHAAGGRLPVLRALNGIPHMS